VARYLAGILREEGARAVVIRHPMPYGDLTAQRCQRFEHLEDLERSGCTVEEREEFEPLLRVGTPVYAGVDSEEVLRRADEEAEVIVWDGGNNDLPFLVPDLEIVVVDPHRPGHETRYHPGEANLRRAQVVVVNKVDTARPEDVVGVETSVRRLNPQAEIVRTASRLSVEEPDRIRGKKILAVEDGPTLTHGGMAYGAATLVAQRFGASELVDPRPYARGSLREAFDAFPHLGNVLPALGYSPSQLRELRDTIDAVPCDLVLLGTPIDLEALLRFEREAVRVHYEIEEVGGARLRELAAGFAKAVRAGG
jgi:predicted GTPase